MCDWIDSLRSKLRQLDVLPARDNLYMREPQPLPRQNSVTNRHNHFRPLPPIPMPPNGIGSPSNISLATTPTRRAGPGTPVTPLTPLSPLAPIATISSANTPTTSALPLPPLARAETPTEIYETIFDGQQQHRQTQHQQQLPAQPPLPARTLHSSQSVAMSASASISSPSGAALEPLNSHVPAEEGPPPYELIAATSSAPVSLRESQVLRLRKEIAHPSGVRLMVRKKDCYHSIALVDMGDGVWLAGWRQKEFPVLHNTFHIGDRLLSINGDPVTTASQAYKLIKQHQLVLEIIYLNKQKM
ncbi:unnamed protein product [Oppiella nova]|uniref:PDZ domain-containing protein n=1 Tax=Oppiella nova TaxID=334625 RepID=A0A7R9M5N9_9ACAR|nr:unnamed protein product [Oppiella nova]CAG2171221.1 unnamed protein product [Oppiella nova]